MIKQQAEEINHWIKKCDHLEHWKHEASSLLDPILNYGQKHPDIKLGSSITDFVLERCKRYDHAERLLDKVMARHEAGLLPDMHIYNEIKSFLDGK